MFIMALGLAVCVAAQPPPVAGSTWVDDPPLVPLEQIRRALSRPASSLILDVPTAVPVFRATAVKPIGVDFSEYLHDLFALNTLQRQSADWASKGSGINLIELARSVRNAFREFEERRIHDQVERELADLRKANATQPIRH
jgi:hypothetical protein